MNMFTHLAFMAIMASSAVNAATFFTPPAVLTYAPVPQTGFGPTVSNTTGFLFELLGRGAYMLTDETYQCLFFVANDSVIFVDAPPTIGHNILKGISTVTSLPVSHMVYSHAHADHIGAAYLVDSKDLAIIAHEETAKELSQAPDANRPFPNVLFSEDLELCVGNQTLQLSYKGPNHEPGNIFIYAPIQKVLMLVDVVYPGWVPFDSLGESQNIPDWIKAHDQLLEYDFDFYTGGHLTRIGTRKDVITQKEYVEDLFSNCKEAIALSAAAPNASNSISVQTALAPVAAANPRNPYALFEYHIHDDLAAWCANKTTRKWLGRLAGADVYAMSNAVAMTESIRNDFGFLGPFGVQG
jgi:glyoxylase-like metal-dependent hydrolase (beta-lactamase superfamily II)